MDRSLVELLDGAVLLYSYGAHKQLQKMSNVLSETVDCYITALDDALDKLNRCPPNVCIYNYILVGDVTSHLFNVNICLYRAEFVCLTKTALVSRIITVIYYTYVVSHVT